MKIPTTDDAGNRAMLEHDVRLAFEATYKPTPDLSNLLWDGKRVIVEIGGSRILCEMTVGPLRAIEAEERSELPITLTKIRELPPKWSGRIETTDESGKPNGYLIRVWNELEEPGERPDQVYVTAIEPGCHKGPHLHKVRCGRFVCIKGNVRIVTKRPDGGLMDHFPTCRCSGCTASDGTRHPVLVGPGLTEYYTRYSGEDHGYARIKVEPGVAACIYNDGPETALVINMPTPAWSKEAPDEWPVEDWAG